MSSVDIAALPSLTVSFEARDTDHPNCAKLPQRLYEQFTAPSSTFEGYGAFEVNCSILIIPDDIDSEWWGVPASYWMRQKVRKALKEGYVFSEIDRNDHADEIYEINTSLEERQGRPMSESYRKKVEAYGSLGVQPCPRHQLRFYGILREGQLYAYSWIHQVGELALFSMIIGHGEHLRHGIMSLMVFEAVKDLQRSSGTRYGMYHLHHGGGEGLTFFKEKMGFRPFRVRWVLEGVGSETSEWKGEPRA